jgi:biotin carboxyl carrier protein
MKRRVRLILTRSGAREEVVVTGGPKTWTLQRAGTTTSIDAVRLPDGRLSLLLEDGRQICGLVTLDNGAAVVTSSRGTTRVPIEDPARRGRRQHAETGDESGEEVRALMPGRVIEVAVSEGQTVAAGTILLVLEAMKMQNEIRASRGGVVARIGAAAGQAVDRGALLVAISPAAGPVS